MKMSENTNRHQPESSDAGTAMETDVLRVLESRPEIAIPADFATRVAARAVAQPAGRTSPWASFGLRIAIGSGALLMLALFAFAPHATPSLLDLRFDFEMVALGELGLVGFLVTRVGLRD